MKKGKSMRTTHLVPTASLALALAFSLQPLALVHAATTITGTNRYAYGANVGWTDWCGDTNNGAVISGRFCSGNLYAANVGWISLGSGAPANGVQYQNNSAGDYGVNIGSDGSLRGYAWGANIGWINFEDNGAAAVDFVTGNLSGYAWGANVGWLSLSNAQAFVQTTTLVPANDLCAGAVALTSGVAFVQDTIGAGSLGDPAPTCASSLGKGVWFTYTPSVAGMVVLSTCGSDFDTALGVYSGFCASLTQVACDDGNGPTCPGAHASVAFLGAAGVIYHILAGGYNSASGTLSIVATTYANDQCAGAAPLTDAMPVTMSTASATSTGDPTPSCQSNAGKGVWFTYTAPGTGDVLAGTCGSDFNTVLAVYSGACGSLAAVACNDNNGPSCFGSRASVRFSATAGVTYHLLAAGYASATGSLTMVASMVPRLAVTQSSGYLTVTWPGNGMLQSTTNLTPVVTWTDVINGGGLWTEPMTNKVKFFRVVK